MKKRNHLDENLKKLLGMAEPEQSLPADTKKEIMENLLRNADMKENTGKSSVISFKFKIAAAIAAIIIIICGICLLNKPAEDKNTPEQLLTKEVEKKQITLPDEIKTADTKNEIVPSIDVAKLAAAGDINGLIAVLNTASNETKVVAANYLAKMGAAGAVEALKKEADNWQQSGENPFAEAVKKIQAVKNAKPAPAVKESNEPNSISKTINPGDPNDPNNWPFVEIWVIDKQTDEAIKDARVKGAGKKISVTDSNGYCKVTLGKKKEDYFSVSVEKEGFVPLYFNWGKEVDRVIPKEYEFYLEKGTVMGGIVRNDQNEPVKDAHITINLYTPEENRKTGPWQRLNDYTITTDADGKWQCDMLPAELLEGQQIGFRITHSDYADNRFWIRQSNTSELQMLQNREFVITVKKGAAIYGYVLDNANRPIAKASVFIGEDRYNPDNLKTKTNDSGYYEFAHAKQGFNVLTVLANGYAPDMKELNVLDAAQAEDFVLAPANTIRGRVVDVNGNPVANTSLNADEWRGYRMVNWNGKTDNDGRFVWNEAPADAVKFDFYKQGYMSSRNNIFTAGQKEYEIVLYPPLVISGTVTIAQTNEPVKDFTITKGLKFSENDNRIHWETGNMYAVKHFTDGKYEFQITSPYYRHILKVETADGRYAVSRLFDNNEGTVKYDFVIGKEEANKLAGAVYNPDGKAGEGVTVYLVRKNYWLNLENGKQDSPQQTEKAITDSQGKFTLPDCNEKFKLVAVSDEGFADVNSSEFTQEPSIYLEKWGRIEGVVYVGSKLAVNQEIRANNSAKYNNRDNINYQYTNRTTTDQNGKFVMEKVIPGQNQVCRIIHSGDLDRMMSTNAARQEINVLPDQTTEVVLGGQGRAIIGKIIWPGEEFYKKMLEIISHIQPQQMANRQALMEKAYSLVGQIPKPTNFDIMTAKQSIEWYKNWSQSSDGKAYYAKLNEAMQKAGDKKIRTSYSGVIIDSDGSFRAEDIEQGDYTMTVNVMEKKGRYGQADYQNPLLNGKFNFTIPQVDESNIDLPLDLGQVTLEVISASQALRADSNAPDFTLETTIAGTVKLADLRGKFVVLVFWNCSGVLNSPENEAKIDGIFDAYKNYGSTANVEFIAVSISAKYAKIYQEIAEKYLREKQCAWKQAFVDYGENTIFTAYKMGYSPAAVVLIGPDGKIVASDINAQQLIDILKSN
ncbi:MAG: carboxypeptidase regulatory-like domain-containing protein [Phycisphaerae bacterium]|jgi:hypothetical protein